MSGPSAEAQRQTGMTDAEAALVRRCQTGDLMALEQLFTAYKDDVFRFAFLVVRDAGLAQDVTQETFIKVFRSIAKFGFRSSFKSWLYRVAVNEAVSLLRRRRVKEELDLAPERVRGQNGERAWQPEEAVLEDEMRRALRFAIDQLDPLHRTVVVLKYYQDFSDAEIAQVLGCPPGTVKSRLHRARELIRRHIMVWLGEWPGEGVRMRRNAWSGSRQALLMSAGGGLLAAKEDEWSDLLPPGLGLT